MKNGSVNPSYRGTPFQFSAINRIEPLSVYLDVGKHHKRKTDTSTVDNYNCQI